MSIEKLIIIKQCPECQSKNILSDNIHQEVWCGNCGLIIEAPYTPDIIYPGFPIINQIREMKENARPRKNKTITNKP